MLFLSLRVKMGLHYFVTQSIGFSMKKNNKISLNLVLVLFALTAVLLYQFGERWLHLFLLYLSGASWARNLVSRIPLAQRVASRFVAGYNVDTAIDAARELQNEGMLVTMDYLGESVSTVEDAIFAKDQILALLDRIEDNNDITANVSVKLSQLGLNIDPVLAEENVRELLHRAQQYDNKIRIDMEDSGVTDRTLTIYRNLQAEFGHRVGIVIQAYLYRTEADAQKLIDEGAWIRLCKGAYAEPASVAFEAKTDTDRNYVHLTEMLLGEQARANGVYLGVATHDEKMISATMEYAAANNIPASAYEFQMLYGVRRDLQKKVVDDGYQMRVYVPYGEAWYPYFVRRLAERPANLWFFMSNFFRQ
jgi:proline dehydrogenase